MCNAENSLGIEVSEIATALSAPLIQFNFPGCKMLLIAVRHISENRGRSIDC